jgi:hypothetical protein
MVTVFFPYFYLIYIYILLVSLKIKKHRHIVTRLSNPLILQYNLRDDGYRHGSSHRHTIVIPKGAAQSARIIPLPVSKCDLFSLLVMPYTPRTTNLPHLQQNATFQLLKLHTFIRVSAKGARGRYYIFFILCFSLERRNLSSSLNGGAWQTVGGDGVA